MTGTLPLLAPMRRLIAAGLVVLLALQVSQSFFPITLETANGDLIQVVICGPEGLHTVTINLADGKVTDGKENGGPTAEITGKCPFCIVGLPGNFALPDLVAQKAEYHRIRYGLTHETQAHPRPAPRVRQIRAPPLTA